MEDGVSSGLNEQQREAVTSPPGPAVVVSGAGTGKTRVLTARFVYLAKVLKIPAWRILAITFTNKAAREMRERIARVGLGADASWVSTFHAFCVRFLRKEIAALGFGADFTIADEEDQRAIMRTLYRELNIPRDELPVADGARHVRALKESGEDPAKYFEAMVGRDRLSIPQRDYVKRLAAAYAGYLKRNNQLDFADLIAFTAKIFRERAEAADRWAARFDAVLIDEFQDTDAAQYEIVARLARPSGNIFAVGDPDQSIYGWRGADAAVADKLRRDFPGTRDFFLRENYRSTNAILSVANDVISRNASPYFKELFSAAGTGPKARLHAAPDQHSEGVWVANRIKEANRRGFPFGSMAVLYRINSQSRALEQALMAAHIPYFIYNGVRFYQRLEVKDLLAYLRLVACDDETSLARVINSPPRRASDRSLDALARYAAQKGVNQVAALADAADVPGLHKPAVPHLLKLAGDIKELRKMRGGRLAPLLNEVLSRTGYLSQFDPRADAERFENVNELRRVLAERDEKGGEGGLGEYLQEIALYTDAEREPKEECVRLMTVHTAKGLEFDCVFVTGLVDGVFPSLRENGSPIAAQLAEERRVLYVALTRAKKELYLSTYSGGGKWGGRENLPSRFLNEIAPELLARDARALKPIDVKAFDDDWYDSAKRADYKKNYYADAPEFFVGERIQHKTFGEGVVVEVKAKTIVVAFAVSIGTRELVSNHRAIIRKSS